MVMLHIKLRESQMQQQGRKYFGQEHPPTPSNSGGQKVKTKFLQNIIISNQIDSQIQKHGSKYSAYIPSPYPTRPWVWG